MKEKQAREYLISQQQEVGEVAKIEAEKELLRKLEYRRQLQDQMIFAEKTKRFKYEEFLKEKKLLDDVMQRIQDENERERQERMCNVMKTRQEMMAFKAAQQLWKEKEIRALEEENRKIQEYIQSKKSGAEAFEELKAQQEATRAKLAERVARNLAEIKVSIFYYYSFPASFVKVVMNE